ncbi:MAG: S41 family peptidase [Thermoproteus sp.]
MRGYYMYPDIYGDDVVFVSEDDLWKFSGGRSFRLTSDFGVVIRPKYSPDGRHIAFTRLQQTDQGVLAEAYVVPADGGQPRRLTYFGSPYTRVAGWTPDGRVLVFSDFKMPFAQWRELYAVSLDGRYERLNLGPATALLYGDGFIVLGRNNYDLPYWKRYRGGSRGVLWISRDGGRTFEKLADLPGNITSPMVVGGRIYFVSDHEGVGNIYSVDLSGRDLRRHTDFKDFYVRNASSDGRRIVFQAGGDIYLLDPSTGRLERLEVDAPLSGKQKTPKFVDPFKYLESFSLPSGEAVVLVSRGQAFYMPTWEGAVVQLGERGGGVRYKHASPDGDKIAVATYDGAVEVYSRDGALLRRLELGVGVVEAIALKYPKLAVSNHKGELWIVDLESGSKSLADRSEYGIMTELAWHPSGFWLAYSKPAGVYVQNIRLYDVRTGRAYDATPATNFDYSPSFDPEGRYLYFLSRRVFNPAVDPVQFYYVFAKYSKPYLVPLRRDELSPFVEYRRREGAVSDIDVEGIERRAEPFPVDEGVYAAVVGLKGGKVAWLKYEVEGALKYYLWSAQERRGAVEIYDLEAKSRDQLASGVSAIRASPDGRYLLLKEEGRLRLVDVERKPDVQSKEPGRKSGVLDLSRIKIYVEPPREWRQMFREAWLLMRENFWRADMNGADWDAVYKKYEPLLDRINTRYELSDLINEMQGELGNSHAYEIVPDFEVDKPYPVGGLGAEFFWDGGCWRVAKIFWGDPANEGERSPLAAPGVDVKEGDCVVSIGGVKLGPDTPPEAALLNRAGDIVWVEVSRGGEVRRFPVRTLREERHLIYREWVERNRRYVHEKTGGRVGYVHIPDMGPYGYAEFFKSLIAEGYKEALIIDVRFNRGGHTSGMLIQRLAARTFGAFTTRHFKPTPYPELVAPKALVLITNEYAGSDGDIFTYDFKALGLGPVVGTRTWGGTVGIDARYKLVDGTIVTQPKYAFWAEGVGTGIEGYGVEPDVPVEIAPHHYKAGVDPQLDRAIEEALRRLGGSLSLDSIRA